MDLKKKNLTCLVCLFFSHEVNDFFNIFFSLKVAQVYRDRSIGNSINIVVVKIVFLETNEVWFRFLF